MITHKHLISALLSGSLLLSAAPTFAEEMIESEEPSVVFEETTDPCAGIVGIMLAQCKRQHSKKMMRTVCTDAGDDREARRCQWGERKQALRKVTETRMRLVRPVMSRALDKKLTPCETLEGAAKRACIQKIRQSMVEKHPRATAVLQKRGITKMFDECRELTDRTERFDCIRNAQASTTQE